MLFVNTVVFCLAVSRPCALAGRLLTERCQQLLKAFPTSLTDDLQLKRGGDVSVDMAMSLQYRMRKKATLMAAISVSNSTT